MTENVNRTLDLGRWLGRHEAFGLVAGRCSAAEVESLRRIRDGQLYLETSKNWEEFCVEQLQSSRRKVDKEIRLLKEFGPAYFQLSQLTRISPEEYRAIQANVTTDGLQVDGELVVFRSENHQR